MERPLGRRRDRHPDRRSHWPGPADEERLQAAGTYHVIAISGGNIAILTMLLLYRGEVVWSCRFERLRVVDLPCSLPTDE